MPAYHRHEIVADDRVGFYHCIVRCVRRAFLCGEDPVSGKNYDHRKEWIRLRLQELAAVFGIDVCGYAVMSNHFHVVLRVRPDLAQDWSDDEVALRWRLLYPPRDEVTGLQIDPERHDLNIITSDPARVAELRNRLAESEFTSAFDRIRSLPVSLSDSVRDGTSSLEEPALQNSIEHISPAEAARPDAWLCELTLNEGASKLPDSARLPEQVTTRVVAVNDGGAEACPCSARPKLSARASDRGYLPIELEKYLSLLDWTGRELRAGSRGTIPDRLSPILDRLGQSGECWLETVRHFGRWFKRAAGGRESLAAAAMRCGRRWFQGQCAAEMAFQ